MIQQFYSKMAAILLLLFFVYICVFFLALFASIKCVQFKLTLPCNDVLRANYRKDKRITTFAAFLE